MAYDILVTCAQVLSGPGILLCALNLPFLWHGNHAARILTAVLVASAAVNVIGTVKISNPPLAFMTGLLECWTIIWAAVLLLHYNPVTDARRRRLSNSPQKDGEYEESGIVWQTYPPRKIATRLAWTLDMLISFRGVGWQFGKVGV
jgi:hypothetical protein